MIVQVGPNIAASPRRPAVGSAMGAAFHLPTAPETTASEQIAAAVPASMAGLLALQEFMGGDPEQRAMQHGHALLAKLSRLQTAILGGGSDDSLLNELSDLAGSQIETPDPRLRALINAVVTRAKIELAKRGR
jgi:hypothetical protein